MTGGEDMPGPDSEGGGRASTPGLEGHAAAAVLQLEALPAEPRALAGRNHQHIL